MSTQEEIDTFTSKISSYYITTLAEKQQEIKELLQELQTDLNHLSFPRNTDDHEMVIRLREHVKKLIKHHSSRIIDNPSNNEQ